MTDTADLNALADELRLYRDDLMFGGDFKETRLMTKTLEALDALTAATRGEKNMDDSQIKHMVGRFLSWKLPETFNPDGGVSFEKYGNAGTPHQYKHDPSGTNLLDAGQAEVMVRYMVEGLTTAATPPSAVTDEVRAPYEFDRYVDGKLMAEGIKVTLAANLTEALEMAAYLSRNDTRYGKITTLVLRSVPRALPPVTDEVLPPQGSCQHDWIRIATTGPKQCHKCGIQWDSYQHYDLRQVAIRISADFISAYARRGPSVAGHELEDRIREYLSALLRTSDGWNRDMSKAPRHHSTEVLLFFPWTTPGTGCAFIGVWSASADGEESCWRDPNDFEELGEPTAWILVPIPPSPEAGHE